MSSSRQIPLQLKLKPNLSFADYHFSSDNLGAAGLQHQLPEFCYLWGPAAGGKTHLLKACAKHWPQTNLILSATTIDRFEFLKILPPQLQLLLLDDIDQLSGHKDSELKLFNLFNHCHSKAIKLIVTAAISPRSENWQLPDLRSRLNSGQTQQIKPLKGQAALELLQKQLQQKAIPFEPNIITYIDNHYSDHYPQLNQLLEKIDTTTLSEKRKLTIPFIKTLISQ